MSGQNWRTEVDAVDYFGHQKKRVELEQRRPVVRRASDLVGPGIGSGAIRITDFNDVLATFNGYYSSAAGALSAPTSTEAFVGTVVSDTVLGGQQKFVGLTTGYEYSRTFTRNPVDPSSIQWGVWISTERVPATAIVGTAVDTSIPPGGSSQLLAPSIQTIGDPNTYGVGTYDVYVLRPGVYTGALRVKGPSTIKIDLLSILLPHGASTKLTTTGPVANSALIQSFPFTFWTDGLAQEIRVAVSHAEAGDQLISWSDISITRTGDIV